MNQALLPGVSLTPPAHGDDLTFTFSSEPSGMAGASGKTAPAAPPAQALQALLPGLSFVARVDNLHVFTGESAAPALPPVTVIGLGMGGPLPPEARRAIREADVLAVPRALAPRFAKHAAKILLLVAPLDAVLDSLEEERATGARCVALADGDPLLYGLGATLARRFPPAALRVLPGVSALQAACARLALPWHNARVVSLHGRNDWMPLAHAALGGGPVAVYTDARHTPDRIAHFLLDRGVDWFRVAVAANLGTPKETLAECTLAEAAQQSFPGGETVLLIPCAPARGPRLGLDESALALHGGLYTKAPVRAAALSLLRLKPTDTMWDIGAGGGCVALEAAALLPRGRVIAVEQKQERALSIRENRRRLGVPHLDIITAFAPLGLDVLPDPDAIFLGGGLGDENSSDQSTQGTLLLNALFARLAPGGTLVAACSLLSSLQFVTRYVQSHGIAHDVQQIQSAASSPLAGSLTLKAFNPVFLVRATPRGGPEGKETPS